MHVARFVVPNRYFNELKGPCDFLAPPRIKIYTEHIHILYANTMIQRSLLQAATV
jgi:hypothetical protein